MWLIFAAPNFFCPPTPESGGFNTWRCTINAGGFFLAGSIFPTGGFFLGLSH